MDQVAKQSERKCSSLNMQCNGRDWNHKFYIVKVLAGEREYISMHYVNKCKITE